MCEVGEKLVIGCGYLGLRVAVRWVAQGKTVHGVTRSPDTAERFREMGICPIVADVTDTQSLGAIGKLENIDTVLFAVGFDRSAGVPIHDVYVDGLQRVLEVLPRGIKRFVYISSTGVYGQTDGSWVDEDSPCEPTRDGGKACLIAEQLLRSSTFADRVIVLRLAGIYGPERVPRKTDLLSNKSFPQTGHLNLIHVEDAAATVLAAEQLATPPDTYVVSDGQPVPRCDYYSELRRLLNIPASTTEEVDNEMPDGTSRKQRTPADKKIRAEKFLRELKVELKFPSYREGLAAILSE